MNATETCPECRAPLPESAPLGMCPGCLLRSARGHTLAGGRRATGDADPLPSAELEELFAGKFAIAELLGRGGMGVVYRARQCRIDRPVAIKLLPFHDGDPGYLERFLREAKALGKLSHPNIVTLIDYGEVGGYFYMVMEFVEGRDLGKRLTSGPLPEAEVARVVEQVCAALDNAHASGIVHRDIKPGNILLSEDGTVKLVDFGLAKGMGASDADLNLTWANELMGTPNYMAPEQGANSLEADHRADIYALGVLTYEMLTGELPSGNFPPPSKIIGVSRAWDRVVLKAMASNPDLRYASAAQMSEKVQSAAGKKRSPLLLIGIMATLVLLIGLAVQFSKVPAGASTSHPSVSRPTGRVLAFGPNLFGQVTKLGSLERDDIVAVAANDEFNRDYCFALALTATGEVVGLGDAPAPPENLGKVASIAVGLAHCLALSDDGTVIAWGYDKFPPPQNLPHIKQVAAAGKLSAALSSDGEVFVWGSTPLGNAIVFEAEVNKDIVEIAAAPNAIFARTADGGLILRGDPEAPALMYRIPDQALTSISAGQEFGMALLHNSRLWSWGWDSIGEVPADDGTGFDKLVCGPETCAVRRGSGGWTAWGKIGAYFPDMAENAIAIDFGHHVGLAVVPASEAENYSPPPGPMLLEKLAILGPHNGEIKSFAYDAERARLFAATDQAIYRYDLDQGTQLIGTYRSPPEQLLTALAWDATGDRLMAASDLGKVHVFTGEGFPKVSQELKTGVSVAVASVAVDPVGGTLLTGDFDGFINVWSGPDLSPVGRVPLHECAITGIAFAGDRLFTYGWDSLLKVSNLSGGLPHDTGVILNSTALGHDLALTLDDRTLLASDWRGTVYRLDLTTMDLSRSWRAHAAGQEVPSMWLGTDANARMQLSISPDGKFLASAGGDRVVRIWDAQTDRLFARSPGRFPAPTHVVTFLDHQRIVTAGEAGNSLAIWRLPPQTLRAFEK